MPLKSESRVRTSLLAVVVIGRNEGERLRISLSSVVGKTALTVYVDSGSMDDSLLLARQLNAEVVELDASVPFTAARARNAGFKRVMTLLPQTEFVQFVDGDCEVAACWIESAADHLRVAPGVAAVIGQQHERYPERSIYNLLCDMEWRWPIGDVKALPGNMMVRAAAFQALNGFREDLIAAEDTELGVRFRAHGWKLYALDVAMTTHDANILRASQWWKRTMRAGYAFAEGVDLHGAPPERHFVRERRRAFVWGLALPLAVAVAVVALGTKGLLLLALPGLHLARVFIRTPGTFHERAVYSVLTMLGKPAEAVGGMRYLLLRWRGRRSALIEYK